VGDDVEKIELFSYGFVRKLGRRGRSAVDHALLHGAKKFVVQLEPRWNAWIGILEAGLYCGAGEGSL
jgi:hypothetical protein